MAGRALALLQDAGPGRNGRWALLALVVLATWLALEQLSAQLWFLPAGLRLAMLWLTPTRRWGWLGAAEVLAQATKSAVLGYPLFTFTFLAVCVAPWLIYAAVVYLLRGSQPAPQPDSPTRMLLLLLAGLLGAAGVSPLLWMFLVTYPMTTADSLASMFAFMYGDLIGQLVLAPLLLALLHGELAKRRGRLWRDLALVLAGALAVFLLLPVTWLPLLVKPHITFGGLALCTAVVVALLLESSAPAGEVRLFGFYYLLSTAGGLVLRRARSNLATRLDKQVETLWQRAVSDPLTGLLNRQGWLNLAGTAMAEALRDGHTPAVLFIDVDHFKRTNAEHGHLAGDDLLRALGQIIDARIGPGEYSARLGGEEFACLLPDATVETARRFAERLAADYRQRARDYGSTLSIGIATHETGDVLNDLLARADAALYQAKRSGRDQVVISQ